MPEATTGVVYETSRAIVVPTLGRVERAIELHRLLHSLTPGPEEIYFVFQDPDEFDEFIRSSSCSAECALLGRTRSASSARNLGLSRVRSDVVAFLDDDCAPQHSTWLAAITAPLIDPSIGLVTGRVLGWDSPSGHYRWLPSGYFLLPWVLEPVGNHEGRKGRRCHTVIGCNFAGRASQLRQIGGFAEEFSSPSLYEETELSLRLRRLTGTVVLYSPEAAIVHSQSAHGGMRDHGPTSPSPDFIIGERMKLYRLCFGRGPNTLFRSLTYRLVRRIRRPLSGLRAVRRSQVDRHGISNG